MSAKQTKKIVAKKTTTKVKPKAAAKKPAAKKTTARVKPKTTRRTTAKTITTSLKIPAGKTPKRPTVNPGIPQSVLETVYTDLTDAKTTLEEYAAHLRALDRQRLNGVGVKKLGFIQAAFELAVENPEYLPHFLTIEKFTDDIQLLIQLRANQELIKQVEELNWNLVMQAADMAYTDALEFYSPVKDAAKRRVDAAESIYKTLETYFKHKKPTDKPETEKEFMRDAKAYYRGKKDGKLEVENISPKRTGGVHKVIDEKFQDAAAFKDTIEGEIDE